MVKKVILLLFIVAGFFAYSNKDRIMRMFKNDTRTVNSSEVKLLFKEDPSLTYLIDVLLENSIVKEAKLIRDFVNENNIDTTQFAAGKYIILSQTQLSDLVKGFVKGVSGHGKAEVKVNVIFNRCQDIYDIGSNISKCIIADSAEIVDCIYSDETLNKYHFTREQIPALFLPGDYQMYFDTDAEAFVAEMATVFKEFWNEDRKQALNLIGLKSPSQATTLASIVYAEQSKVPEEWPIIAKLYLNRLDVGMKLQSDPTFKFCWGRELDGVQRLLNSHRERDCPYNTYLYTGLPPGPIQITPSKVIDAVLHPEDVNYIFMCAKPEYSGKHNFTASGRQHSINASAFQKWIAAEQKRNR